VIGAAPEVDKQMGAVRSYYFRRGGKMIRHIVEFTLKSDDPLQRAADIEGMKTRLCGLLGVVPGVSSIEVGADLGLVDGHWDVVLVTEHPSNEDLLAYQKHAAHQEVVAWISGIVSARASVDYEH
jgi:hypothetical protein